MDLKLDGKTALVTGGSAGIGKGIALALAKEGVDVAICARRREPLDQTAAEIARETNRRIVPIPADLSKDADVRCLRYVLPIMVKQGGGRVVNLIGNDGVKPSYWEIAPGAANAAGQNLTISLAGQYGKHNISFCAVNPGPVRTERWAGLVTAMSRDMNLSYEEADKLAPASIPLGRIAEVEEVATLVVMLASPLMHMVNGTQIEVDGGQEKSLMDRLRDRR